MNLVASEDRLQICKQAEQLLGHRAPIDRLRRDRDEPGRQGWDRTLWLELAELGWLTMHRPESEGGAGMGFADLCALLEVSGRRLASEPWISLVLAGELLRSAAQPRPELAASLGAGTATVAVAWQEPQGRYDRKPHHLAAEPTTDGWTLHGTKAHVLDAADANAWLATARDTGTGASLLLLVVPDAPGVTLQPERRIDGRPAATLRFAGTPVSTGDRLDLQPAAEPEPWRQAFDLATIALASQMVGSAHAALNTTLDYLRVRKQFGVPIGSFQALQHRAARMFVELEVTRSAVLGAAASVDDQADDLPLLASLAKARATETLDLIARESIQMHGGIGVTDEHDIGFFLKRWRGDDALLGDAAWHRSRWARLSGY